MRENWPRLSALRKVASSCLNNTKMRKRVIVLASIIGFMLLVLISIQLTKKSMIQELTGSFNTTYYEKCYVINHTIGVYDSINVIDTSIIIETWVKNYNHFVEKYYIPSIWSKAFYRLRIGTDTFYFHIA